MAIGDGRHRNVDNCQAGKAWIMGKMFDGIKATNSRNLLKIIPLELGHLEDTLRFQWFHLISGESHIPMLN